MLGHLSELLRMTTSPSDPKPSRGRELAARLADMLHRYLTGRALPDKLSVELRKLADWIDSERAPAVAKEREQWGEQVQDVFRYWKAATGKKLAKLTPERRIKVLARLKDGTSVAQMKRAIDGVCSSGFHSGANSDGKTFLELEMICRNATNVERYAEMAEQAPTELVRESHADARLDDLRATAAQYLKEGNTSAYNETQREIRWIVGGPNGSEGKAPIPAADPRKPRRVPAGDVSRPTGTDHV
jgi:hypothetical protein